MSRYILQNWPGLGVNALCVENSSEIRRDGRTVLEATSALTLSSSVCWIDNPMLVALNTVELKRRCYNCYNLQHDPLAPEPEAAEAGKLEDRYPCRGCGVVFYCSPVRF